MDKWEQKDMSGNCYKQDLSTKTAEEREWMSPWSGQGMIDGKMYWINMYDNVSQAGNPYRRMKFKPMQAEATYSNKPKSASPTKNYKGLDDVPWDD